jgi:hypothetical protein
MNISQNKTSNQVTILDKTGKENNETFINIVKLRTRIRHGNHSLNIINRIKHWETSTTIQELKTVLNLQTKSHTYHKHTYTQNMCMHI